MNTLPPHRQQHSDSTVAIRQRGGLAATKRSPGTPVSVGALPSAPLPLPRQRVDAVSGAVLVYLLVAVAQVNAFIPLLRILRPGITAALLSVALIVADGSRARSAQWLTDFTSRCVLLLTTWSVLTIPMALFPGVAWRGFSENFVKVVVLYSVIVLSVRSMRDVQRLVAGFGLGGAFYCLYVWRSGQMTAMGDRVTNLSGSGYDPNDFAAFAVGCVPFLLYVAGSRLPVWTRLAAIPGLGLVLIGIVLSGSRGGLLGLSVAIALILWRFDALSRWLRIAGVIAGTGFIAATASDAWWDRMATLLNPSEDYNMTADVGRTAVWKRGLGYFAQRPLTGVGAENFPVAEGVLNPLLEREQYGIGVSRLAAHNSFIQILTELGVPGIALFLGTIGGALMAIERGLRLAGRRPSPERALGHALTASLAGVLVCAIFLSHGYSAMLYSLFALAVAFEKAMRMERTPPAALAGP